jgi:hypothetical protein
MQFQINNWSDNSINVTVASGMSSGVIVVSVSGQESQSGQVAKLTIGQVVPGSPIINALSPDFGRRGVDQVLITGLNFGSSVGSSRVLFTGSGGTQVEASIVEIEIGGTPTPQWTNSSVKAFVPEGAVTGNVVERAAPVLALGDDAQVGPGFRQSRHQRRAQQALVLGDHAGSHGCSPGAGRVIVAATPLGKLATTDRLASAP